jgi:hypothetical protein
MPKDYPRDRFLFAVDEARKAHKNNESILIDLTDNKDLEKVIQKNLN